MWFYDNAVYSPLHLLGRICGLFDDTIWLFSQIVSAYDCGKNHLCKVNQGIDTSISFSSAKGPIKQAWGKQQIYVLQAILKWVVRYVKILSNRILNNLILTLTQLCEIKFERGLGYEKHMNECHPKCMSSSSSSRKSNTFIFFLWPQTSQRNGVQYK